MSRHEHRHDSGADKHAVHLALVGRLRDQAVEIRRLTDGLDEAALARRTMAGKWSPKELVCHFRRMEEIFSERLQEMLSSDAAEIVPYHDPDSDEAFNGLLDRPTADVRAEFLDERDALCRRLEALSPADWHRTAKHPEFSHYDVHFMIEYMAHHEAHHIYQLFQRRVPLGKLPH